MMKGHLKLSLMVQLTMSRCLPWYMTKHPRIRTRVHLHIKSRIPHGYLHNPPELLILREIHKTHGSIGRAQAKETSYCLMRPSIQISLLINSGRNTWDKREENRGDEEIAKTLILTSILPKWMIVTTRTLEETTLTHLLYPILTVLLTLKIDVKGREEEEGVS